jgi:hypothetical protein
VSQAADVELATQCSQNKKRPKTLSDLETPEQPSPEVCSQTTLRSRVLSVNPTEVLCPWHQQAKDVENWCGLVWISI